MNIVYDSAKETRKKIRRLILLFILGLLISGITAFPLETELWIANEFFFLFSYHNFFTDWIDKVYRGVKDANATYPFLAYGTDWLAFAHLILAVLFIGPLRDPVKNKWVIEFGLIACVAIFPLAMIAGAVREIPFFWRLLDCSFGVIGGGVLWICYRKIRHLEMVTESGIVA
ncbi:MAG: hypothetical protein DI538_17355 [Azospira oryzae]|nr:MAG: hypothetical protein DI538_17355 [Azospira oryzae]